jgi:8-oxo-dGTP diphosphatase
VSGPPLSPVAPIREYPPAPIVGVGGVVLSGGRVLLVRRSHPPLQGQWSIPGGAVELGETLTQAVTREVLEETGLHVKTAAFLTTFDRIARDSEGHVQYHYVLTDFLCRPEPPEGEQPAAGSDALEAAWVRLEELHGPARYALPDWTLRVIQRAVELSRTLPEFSPQATDSMR